MKVTSSYPSARIKLDELFLDWLLIDGDTVIDSLFEDLQALSVKTGTFNQNSNKLDPSATNASITTTSTANNSISSSTGTTAAAFARSPKKRSQEVLYEANANNNNSANATHDIIPPSGSVSANNIINSSSNSNNVEPPTQLVADMHIGVSRRRNNFDVIPKFFSRDGSHRLQQQHYHHRRGRGVGVDGESMLLADRRSEIESYFRPFPHGVPVDKFVHVTKKLCGLPSFFNQPFCKIINELCGEAATSATNPSATSSTTPPSSANKSTSKSKTPSVVQLSTFLKYWTQEIEPYDCIERFFRVVKQRNSNSICKDDFVPYMKELLHFHPGLEFLSTHDEFKRKYALTVITRIFFKVNTSRSGKLSLREVRRSNLFAEFIHVDEEIDINRLTHYFSYEHFYVLYCRFFELDTDKDGRLMPEDLLRYGDHCLSEAIVERVFQVGYRAFSDNVTEGFLRSTTGSSSSSTSRNSLGNSKSPTSATTPTATAASSSSSSIGMTIPDFIFFMLAEEDKGSAVALRFWFDCVDLDGDGKLSYNDMWHFFRAQQQRVLSLGHDNAQFNDVLCQMIDYLNPADPLAITLDDMLRPDKLVCSGLLFDVLLNFNKFLRFEQRDPFQDKLRREDGFDNDWNRFAYYEYIKLASEEEEEEEEEEHSDYDEDAMTMEGRFGAMHEQHHSMEVDHYNNNNNNNYRGNNNNTGRRNAATTVDQYNYMYDDEEEVSMRSEAKQSSNYLYNNNNNNNERRQTKETGDKYSLK